MSELVPTLNNHYRLQFEQAQASFVLLFPEGMIKLNDSAGEILSMIDGKRDQQAIITALQHKYPDVAELAEQVTEFLQIAHQKQWIEYPQ